MTPLLCLVLEEGQEESLVSNVLRDSTITFFGFRICPGRHMAINSVWMAVVSVLATFKISKAKDAQGNEITVEPLFRDGLLR